MANQSRALRETAEKPATEKNPAREVEKSANESLFNDVYQMPKVKNSVSPDGLLQSSVTSYPNGRTEAVHYTYDENRRPKSTTVATRFPNGDTVTTYQAQEKNGLVFDTRSTKNGVYQHSFSRTDTKTGETDRIEETIKDGVKTSSHENRKRHVWTETNTHGDTVSVTKGILDPAKPLNDKTKDESKYVSTTESVNRDGSRTKRVFDYGIPGLVLTEETTEDIAGNTVHKGSDYEIPAIDKLGKAISKALTLGPMIQR